MVAHDAHDLVGREQARQVVLCELGRPLPVHPRVGVAGEDPNGATLERRIQLVDRELRNDARVAEVLLVGARLAPHGLQLVRARRDERARGERCRRGGQGREQSAHHDADAVGRLERVEGQGDERP